MESGAGATALVGREREMVALRGRLQEARAGRAGTVLIGGDAGIGKTRLINELTTDVPDRVLWGACLPIGQRGLPYLAVIDVLRGLTADERRLVPPALRSFTSRDEAAGAAVSRSQLFQAVLELLERLASRQSLVVVIEDLHWADTSLLDLLDFLTGLLREQRILLLATFRADDNSTTSHLGEILGEWVRRPSVTRSDLAPLLAKDALRLVVQSLGREGAGQLDARRLAARAAGNPFFLEQLAAAHGSGERIPRQLQDLLLTRTQALPAQALRVLRIASVGGVSIDEKLVAGIAGLPVDEVRSLLRTAMSLQLLTVDADGVRFRHALLAEALEQDLLPAERRDYHAAYAAGLNERDVPPPPARLAVHLAEAGQQPQALVAWTAAAARAEQLFAFAEARHSLEAARALWDQVDAPEQLTATTSIALCRRLAEASFDAGDAEAASRVARALLDDLDPDGDPLTTAMVHHRLARYLLDTPEHAQALAVQERAVALVPSEPPSPERAEAIAGLARILLYEHRFEEARARAEEAVALAQATEAVHAEVSARNTLGAALDQLGGGDAAAVIREAMVLAREIHSAHEQARSLWNLNQALFYAARWEELAADAAATIDALRRLRPAWTVKYMENVAETLFMLGRWDEAVMMIDAARREDPTRVGTGLPELHLARGELAQAQALLAERRAVAVAGGVHEHLWHEVNEAEAELADGGPRRAMQIIDRVLTRSEGLSLPGVVGYACVTGLRAAADLVTTRGRARSDAERAEALAIGRRCHAEMVTLLDQPGRADGWKREAMARAAQCEAELSRLEGDHEPEAWQTAVERWDALSVPYYAAYCRFRWAEASLGCGGDRDEVAKVLAEVLALLGRLGEVRLATDVRRLARRARLDVGDGDGASSAAFGLTRRELEVLRQLAVGATNRQIAEALYISEKTASVHVSNILRKLQVANRGEAAATAIREGLADVTEAASRV